MSAYGESMILQIYALVTNGLLPCIRAGTWDTECIHMNKQYHHYQQYCMDKNATAIERQLFVQDLVALRGADRLISMSRPGWEAKQGTSMYKGTFTPAAVRSPLARVHHLSSICPSEDLSP